MTNLLLGYLCASITLICALEVSERWSAGRSRQFQRDVFTDLVEANLLLVEQELGLAEEADHVVTRASRQDERGDEEHLKAELAHDLMVVARSEGAALR